MPLKGHFDFEDINTKRFSVAQKSFCQAFLKTTGKDMPFSPKSILPQRRNQMQWRGYLSRSY